MKHIIIIAALLIAPSALAEWGTQIWGVDPWEGDKEDDIFINGFESDPSALSATVRDQGDMVSAESTVVLYRSDDNINSDDHSPILKSLAIESLTPDSDSPQGLLIPAP